MMDLLRDSLERVDRYAQELGRYSLRQLLRPGVGSSRVRKDLELRDLMSSDDLEILYGWHNGTDTTTSATLDDLHLFPGYYFLSFEDAVSNYDSFIHSQRWQKEWLPVFANGGGDFYATTCTQDARPRGSVVHFRIDEHEHPLEFESLAAMLWTIVGAFEQGIFYVDDRGYLEMNDEAFMVLARDRNPNVSWWNDEF